MNEKTMVYAYNKILIDDKKNEWAIKQQNGMEKI